MAELNSVEQGMLWGVIVVAFISLVYAWWLWRDTLRRDKGTPEMEKVWNATKGQMGDVVINVANIPETEMSCILAAKSQGIVYFFSMATSFTRAALGAEGVGADLDLRIGNGYTEGHAELALDLLRESPELYRLFTETYA